MGQVIYGYIVRAIGQILLATTAGGFVHCEPGHAEPTLAIRPPPPQGIRIELEPANLRTIDFMTVKNCALKTTILKNQTRIARYASDSQQLLLDLEYLHLAPACIALMHRHGLNELAQTLDSARLLIHQQLPARIFNATLGGGQYHQLWQTGVFDRRSTAIRGYPLQALREINQSVLAWLSGDYRANNLELEIQLSEAANANVYQGEFYRQQMREILRLEYLLQETIPLAYQLWKQRR